MFWRRRLLLAGLGGLVAAGGIGALAAARSFRAAMATAEARVSTGSRTIPTRFGALEYADAGEGPAVLMIHGTGGGFDQGLAFGRPLVEAGYRLIAPSRFGYLGSDLPDDPGPEAQADAFVELLDHLGLPAVAAVGGSAGALSAIAFAIRHPSRCAALVAVVPATYAPARPTAEPMSPTAAAALEAMLRSDLLFWLATTLAEDRMIGTVLATDPALVRAASPTERERVLAILREILPVSRRTDGFLADAARTADPAPVDLAAIRAPTLAVSFADDRFGTFDAARHIAGAVPGARFLGWPRGGHVYVGHEAEMFAGIVDFLADTGWRPRPPGSSN